jgi:hypothetical protein
MTIPDRNGGSMIIETERLRYPHPCGGKWAAAATSFSDVGESNGAPPRNSNRRASTESATISEIDGLGPGL